MTEVTIGRANLAEITRDLDGAVAVLHQPGSAAVAGTVAALVEGVECKVVRIELPDGEAAKTLAVVADVAERLGKSGLKRSDTVIAVGGGSLTDAGGFIASVYMRGVAARYVPTTLLGAVDAAIGGKTAVNVAGKNLVGTFALPEQVVIDLDVLSSLGEELRRDGLAEALKAGAIGDPGLFDLIAEHGLSVDLDEAVPRAVAVKQAVVDEDLTESGRRAILNFGHTVGHAVETVAGWSHGRSVAVGMVAAASASRAREGFASEARLVAAVRNLGLPMSAAGVDRGAVLDQIGMDKKRDAAGVRMVLLAAVGHPIVRHVDAATLEGALDSIGIT